ncbi:endolytic transglycosylase MltG [Streptomyces tritici]|uniref:endolytic transglycosylase MltG n=1 Tax=Streptomyces tritici TaxID=2054410 RepID=UPI003AEFDF46
MTHAFPRPEPPRRRRSRGRLTRRGRMLLLALALFVATAAVAVPLLLLRPEAKPPPVAEKKRTLLIPEGWRAGQVYAAVDRALKAPAGTARKAMKAVAPTLPAAARGNPEGYLFPATYPIESTTTAESLLRYMVRTAGERFGTAGLTAGAQRHGLSLHETVIVASIVQAEADSPQDMAKVARVVHNRLARGMALQMDSTLNYALNRSTVDTSYEDTRIDSPYNTYARTGLPPTPIANPGEQAMAAAVDPAPGDWLYFVTVRPGDTRFTADYAEQQRNVQDFNEERRRATAS